MHDFNPCKKQRLISTDFYFCNWRHLFMAASPLSGREPMRPRNGLEMSAGANQSSLSGRALSCSLDELGLKYLNHRGGRGAKAFHSDC